MSVPAPLHRGLRPRRRADPLGSALPLSPLFAGANGDGRVSSAKSARGLERGGRTRAQLRGGGGRADCSHPDKEHLIRAFGDRFDEMIPGRLTTWLRSWRFEGARGTVFALTNWSSADFSVAAPRFPFLAVRRHCRFGDEGLIKPDERLFRRLLSRYGIDTAAAVFVDDDPGNARAATQLKFHGIHFRGAAALRDELRARSGFSERNCHGRFLSDRRRLHRSRPRPQHCRPPAGAAALRRRSRRGRRPNVSPI